MAFPSSTSPPGDAMLALALSAFALAADPAGVPLYPGKAPLAVGDSTLDAPTLTPYLVPDKKDAAGVVICPGGGYGSLADDHEGRQVARFLNTHGVHAFVLKYRITGKDRPGPLLTAPLLDAQRALRTVRAKAAEYGVDPKKVGVLGFSAGGHLASTAATHFDAGKPDDADPVEKASCRPDFAVLAYPVISFRDDVTHRGSRRNLLGDEPTPEQIAEFSNDEKVTKDTPPTFLFHTDEDTGVLPENAARFYLALKKHKVPAELHVYAAGKHGIGLGKDPKWNGNSLYAATWPDHLAAWMTVRGITAK